MVKAQTVTVLFIIATLVYQIPLVVIWPGWIVEPGAWTWLYVFLGPAWVLITYAMFAFCWFAGRLLPKEEE